MARKQQTTAHRWGSLAGSIKSNTIQTTDSTIRAIKDALPIEEFYELEPVEILEVHLDDTKSSFPKTIDDTPD